MWSIGVDVGGTFTDIVMITDEGDAWHLCKVPSSPDDLSAACQQGIEWLLNQRQIDSSDVQYVVHGTTAPINALIQRRGAETAMIVTRGFRDVIEIGRQNKPDRYNLRMRNPDPLASRDRRFEIDERILADGTVFVELDPSSLDEVVERARSADVQSIAICLLNAYANSEHEEAVEEALRKALPESYLSRSSQVANEFREYERFSTTVLNSYVGPVADGYFDRFQQRLNEIGVSAPLAIFQSNGGVNTVDGARRHPVSLLMSGPAAGVMAAANLGKLAGQPNLITLDMGGTSCDVGVIVDGEPLQVTTRLIEGFTVRSPMIDVHSIGAGGGSIAWIDQGGLLRVGPYSAGSRPGPACYGKGGTDATVTDANLALGRLTADAVLGGEIKLNYEKAREAIRANLSEALDLPIEQTAAGVLDVVNSNMARAVRVMTVERGYDPRDFALVAFGGAGALHACDLAEELGIPQVIVPRTPGALCALGALLADFRLDFTQTQLMELGENNQEEIHGVLSELRNAADQALRQVGSPNGSPTEQWTVDSRYVGQNYELPIPISAEDNFLAETIRSRFHDEHLRLYGYSQPDAAVQAVNYRLTLTIPAKTVSLSTETFSTSSKDETHRGTRPIYFKRLQGWRDTPAVFRDAVDSGQTIDGPLLIEQEDATVLVPPEWSVVEDEFQNLVISRSGTSR